MPAAAAPARLAPIGIIAGTGAYDAPPGHESLEVDTTAGPLTLQTWTTGARRLYFLNRHGAGHTDAPHEIPHTAHMAALRAAGADAVLALQNVGGLRPHVAAGDLVIPDALHALYAATAPRPADGAARPASRLDRPAVTHVDMEPPYCPHLRSALAQAALTHFPKRHTRGTYVATRGPRLETAAEVRHLATLGDVVGMTGGPEAVAAREAGLCYAALAFVANPAAGLGGPLAATAIRDALAARRADLLTTLVSAATGAPATRDCGCRTAPARGRLSAPAAATPP